MSNPFRDLPSMTKLLDAPALVAACERHPRAAIAAAARAALDTLRHQTHVG